MFHILGFTQGAAEVIRTCLTAFYMHFAHTLTSRFCVHRYQFPFQCQSTGSQIYYGIVGQEVDFTPESGANPYCVVFRSCQRFPYRFWRDANFAQICPNLPPSVCLAWPLQAQIVDPLTQCRTRGNPVRVIKLRFPFNCTFHENALSGHVWSGLRLLVYGWKFSETVHKVESAYSFYYGAYGIFEEWYWGCAKLV